MNNVINLPLHNDLYNQTETKVSQTASELLRLPDLLAEADVLPVLEGINLILCVDEVFSWLKRRS